MRKAKKILWNKHIHLGVLTLALVLTMGLAMEQFSFVSHAESKGKVVASSSVNIRKEPSAGSDAVGSAEKDASVDIRGKVTASDGTVWYQVFVNANTLGYVRSDLVQITDGTTPPTVEVTSSQTGNTDNSTGNTSSVNTTTNANETPAEVTAVQPLSATVTNGQKVRVRSNASTTSSIVTSVQSGLALTVTGQATGTDGKTWYQVEFIANGANVVGFIRSDYVSLSGEVVPADAVSPEEPAAEPQVPEETQEPEQTKTWETQLQGDKWYLLNMETNNQYGIDDLFNGVKTNGDLYEASQKTVKSQKVVIVILVILLVAAAAIATLLFLKIKDMDDSAYFSEIEKDTLRRRGENSTKSGQKVVHTVGPDKKPGTRPSGSQPQGARPAGAQPQGTRPAGARPTGAQPQGTRPAGARPAGAQPQGTRPAGAQPQGERPAGAQPQGARPAGARPAGAQPQGARPAGAQPQGTRPAGTQPQERKPMETQPNPGWKSKNFMSDDEEFEFEFLNWDGEEEQ